MKIVDLNAQQKTLILRLVISFVAIAVLFVGLAALAEEVHDGDTLRYDEAILNAIHTKSTPALDVFFSAYTNLAGPVAVIVMTAGSTAYLLFKRKYYSAALVATGVVGATAINLIVKSLFERTRPDLWTRLVDEQSFSFPSGHSMASAALACVIIIVMWRTKWRFAAILIGAMYVLTIGLSRLYLGVHYPTDVLAGWALSVIWVACVTISLYGYRYKRSTRLTHSPIKKKDIS